MKKPKTERELSHKKFAMTLLEAAKENLLCSGSLMPTVMVVGNQSVLRIYGLHFSGLQEKLATYKDLWDQVLPTNPKVIVTLNDSYGVRMEGGDASEKALALLKRYGDLHSAYQAGDEHVYEVLSMCVYPRGEHGWSCGVIYDRRSGRIVFGKTEINKNEDGKSLGGELGPEPWCRSANVELDRKKERVV
jgi:hypothetical protein